jgi:PIN domain nuclease of toxin-antitoxin system
MTKPVLDASALLAFLFEEQGAPVVEELIASGGCYLSAVNYSEVVLKLGERGVSSEQLALDFEERGFLDLVEIVDFTPEMAEAAADLRGPTKSLGLSLGDRTCLALAKFYGVPAVTTDRAWTEVPGVTVRAIR